MEFKRNLDHTCKIIELLDPDAENNSTIRKVGKHVPLKKGVKSYKARILQNVFTKAFGGDSIAVTGCSVPVINTCHYRSKLNCDASNIKLFSLEFQ